MIRVRWYGGKLIDSDDSFPVPSDEDPFVYVERKTHHETEDSIKERFKIKRKFVAKYLTGALTLDSLIEKMVTKGIMTSSKAQEAKRLAQEIQASIVGRGFRPICRTVYHRTAFQSSTSNDVSEPQVDRDSTVLAERINFILYKYV